VLLDRIAQRFENAEQPPAEAMSAPGWGQFLDDPKSHRQIGPYGTSAGLIVSALAGRGSAALQRVSALPESWWAQWKDYELPGRKLLYQTPRLAFLYLALRISNVLNSSIHAEVEQELLKRMLPSGMWGNYWASSSTLDQTPRLFCSSIVVIALTLLREVSPALIGRLSVATTQIEASIMGNKDLPLLHLAAATTAILSARRGELSTKLRGRIRQIAWSTSANLGDLGVYFYDFQYAGENGILSDRDYFIVPSELLIGIAGMLAGAPMALRQRAETAVKGLEENIKRNNGAYRSDPEQRISSKNQAWAALLLTVSGKPSPSYQGLSRVWYALRKERRGNWFTEIVFPLISLSAITSEIVVFRELGPSINVMTGIGGVIISGLYGSTFLRKWFPGR